jgi:D-amino-acid dehydrogenase
VPAHTVPSGAGAPARHDPDVLVVGGGAVGLFCAYYLRLTGASVAVLERGALGGPQSCSYGNTGFVGTQGAVPLAEPGVVAQGLRWLLNPQSPFYIKPRLDPGLARWLWHFRGACNPRDAAAGFAVLVEMKKRSLDILRELCASGALAATFAMPGMVLAFKTEQGFDKARAAVPQAVASGVPLRVLGPGELRELEPDTEFDIHGALFNADGAFLAVPGFLTEFGALLRAVLGVDIHENSAAVSFETSGNAVRRVRTAHAEFTPGEVVIAAGAWSARCARKLGVPVALQPAKGYSVTVTMPPNGPRLPVILGEGKVALAPLGDRLRLGGTLELSGMDGAVCQRRVAGILRTVRDYLPGLAQTETLEVWSGLRPCLPDGLPAIGRAGRHRNLVISCGHGHIGMGLAPYSGRLVAQIVAGERPGIDLAPLRVDRCTGWARR